jgi:hypothetical protein
MSGSARSGGTGLGCAGSGVMGSIGRREVGRLDMRGSVGRLDHWVQVVDLRSITLGENPLCAPESYENTQFAPGNVDITSVPLLYIYIERIPYVPLKVMKILNLPLEMLISLPCPCSKFSHPSCLYRHLSLRIAPLKL